MDNQTQPSVQYSIGEHNCRCIANIMSNKRHIFAIGTCDVKRNNEVHIIEFLELESKIVVLQIIPINGSIEKIVTKKDFLYVIYFESNTKTNLAQTRQSRFTCISIENDKYQINYDLQQDGLFKYSQQYTSIICHETENLIYLCTKKSIIQFDLNRQQFDVMVDGEEQFFLSEQDPYHTNLFVRSQGNQLCIQDTRDKKITKFKAHSLQILDIDFNPNKQYYLMTGGEDCLAKVWDIRKTQYAMKSFDDLQNSVLQAKFNRFHDQLVALSFDDGTISLHNITSVSSVPQLVKEDDYLVKQFDEHEDSIYGLSWSSTTAWVLGSIGYSGHAIINMVPTAEKYKILL